MKRFTVDQQGRLTAASSGATPALASLTLTAGAGLTGTGDLSAGRTFAVGAHADGSIVVNADDIQVGVLASDAQHGARGGGTQHANAVAAGAAGFMTGADKSKLDNFAAGDTSWTAVSFQNSWVDYGSGFSTGAYRKLGLSYVILRGVIGGGVANDTAFTLPSGYRPGQKLAFSNGAGTGTVYIDTDGTVDPQTSNVAVFLDGIRFLAEN